MIRVGGGREERGDKAGEGVKWVNRVRIDRVRGREGLGRRQHQYTCVVDLLIRAPFGCVLVH